MKNYSLLALIFSTTLAQGQITDNFSDGDFTNNPAWTGTADKFVINSVQQLQLSAKIAGTSFLSTAFRIENSRDLDWEATVRQSFSPSGSNFGRVYLISDQGDVTKPLHGYFLQFGEGGSNDAIELFKQNGSINTSVCRSKNGGIANAFSVRIHVTAINGVWSIGVDYSGGTDFITDATGVDSTYLVQGSPVFFGIMCVYTVSNDTKFFYDEIYAGTTVKDKTPPEINSAKALSENVLMLNLSEELDAASADLVSNYNADHGLGTPQVAKTDTTGKAVTLTFAKSFENGIRNILTVAGIRDLALNAMPATQISFTYFHPTIIQPKDIIISEILADPIPAIGLPAAEYIEIYNRSADPVDLAGFTLSDGGPLAVFPSQIILPQEYWIATSASSLAYFTSFSNVLGLSGFPTLNNDGDDLVLKNSNGVTIDSVNYDITWYNSTTKAEGGWSLELIDVNNPCGERDNWTASEDPKGGTPGKQNSVFASKPDVTGPALTSVVCPQPDRIVIAFDEKLAITAPVQGSFQLDPVIRFTRVHFTDQSLRKIQIDLDSDLVFGHLYTLTVSNVSDCNGNTIRKDFEKLRFALPQAGDSLDVVVNEILFNPRPSGVDFVEVYNNSLKYINLKDWKLANYENGVLSNVVSITGSDILFPPAAYLVFTSDTVLLKNNYPAGKEKNFIKVNLPSLPDDEGSIVLTNETGKIIDYFFYNKSYHTKLLKDDEGVSLERISFSASTNDSQNWKSASAASGFATPGFLNSNARLDNNFAQDNVVIDPQVFIPQSGMNDFAKINYEFNDPGWVANIYILDQRGRIIKTLSNNETLGTEGFFKWDGDQDDGTKARMGYYLVWFQVFDNTGNVKVFRKRVIVASQRN